MKFLKMLGLAAVAAMALMAFLGASSASATTLTCAVNVKCAKGTVIKASLEGTIKETSGITVECTEGAVNGSTENEGSETETVKLKTTAVTFNVERCNNCSTITVTNGTLEIHTQNNSTTNNHNGTLTASGFTFHTICFGITCNYITGNNKDLGTLTGSSNLGGNTATIDLNTTLTPHEGSSFLCGSGNATWEGSYTVTSPDFLDVD